MVGESRGLEEPQGAWLSGEARFPQLMARRPPLPHSLLILSHLSPPSARDFWFPLVGPFLPAFPSPLCPLDPQLGFSCESPDSGRPGPTTYCLWEGQGPLLQGEPSPARGGEEGASL